MRQTLTAPCGARPPRFWESQVSAPVGESPPTGATALEIHEMNRHSRKNGGKRQHVPEEASHGVSSFSGGNPTATPQSSAPFPASPFACPARQPSRWRVFLLTFPQVQKGH